MVLADSHRISRVPRYSGAGLNGQQLRLRGCHALRLRFPADSAAVDFFLLPVLQPRVVPCDIPGLGSSAFARHYLRNHCYFLFLRVLRCFSSPRSPCGSIAAVPGSLPAGFPIRTSAGHKAFAPHRGFSQLVTSFFASESHRHPPCALLCFPFFFSPSLDRLPSLC